MNPKELFESDGFTPEQIELLKQNDIKGVMKLDDFAAIFKSIEGRTAKVELTSAGVWIIVTSSFGSWVIFVEQADRTLADGEHPWEIPSGKVDSGRDKDIFETTRREIREELGFYINDNIYPICIAIKRELSEIPEILPFPSGNNQEIWVEDGALWTGENLKGGLISICEIGLDKIPHTMIQTMARRFPNHTPLIEHFTNVDHKEISRIAMVPLQEVLNGSSPLLQKSSHMWAQVDGFRAFMRTIGDDEA
jgi:hypothetical protein